MARWFRLTWTLTVERERGDDDGGNWAFWLKIGAVTASSLAISALVVYKLLLA